jgi:hypothetical protein
VSDLLSKCQNWHEHRSDTGGSQGHLVGDDGCPLLSPGLPYTPTRAVRHAFSPSKLLCTHLWDNCRATRRNTAHQAVTEPSSSTSGEYAAWGGGAVPDAMRRNSATQMQYRVALRRVWCDATLHTKGSCGIRCRRARGTGDGRETRAEALPVSPLSDRPENVPRGTLGRGRELGQIASPDKMPATGAWHWQDIASILSDAFGSATTVNRQQRRTKEPTNPRFTARLRNRECQRANACPCRNGKEHITLRRECQRASRAQDP